MSATRLLCLCLALIAAPLQAAAPADDALRSVAERSGFVQTGRYDEVIRLCAAYAARWPQALRCIDFGTTPEGRPMKALVASTSGALTPDAAHARQLPVVLIQGGIHAGEIDGKDAGLLALREVLDGELAKGALDRQVLVFVPVFNVDGHERFGRWNRPNQVGPEAMGWRTTAQNFNLNRDYLKADAPEMQAMLRLMNDWDPILSVDLHVTDGAKFQHDISITMEPVHAGDAAMQKAGLALRGDVVKKLAQQGSLPLSFYPSFVVDDDPASGFADNVPPPRFSHGYPLLRNRYGMLVETHSWKDYPTRVRITRNTIVAVLEQTAQHGREWLQLADAADVLASRLGGTPVALTYAPSDTVRTIDFLGYVYTRTPSEISGALMTRYDDTKPQVWHLPIKDDIRPALSVTAPKLGYLVPAADASWVAAKLRLHSIAFETLSDAQPQRAVQAFRASQVTFAPRSFESHQMLTLAGDWREETRDLAAGALLVPIAQPKARLVMALLEPQAPDSLAAWGFFNNAFEQKEYMEAYVAEDVARDMLVQDPQVAAAFTDRLAHDADFAQNPRARLAFFAQRAPSWDERLNLYPVLRVER
ncbi:M14 family metallopeptidase [Solimonas variicoloris]|uniref:M14 family metallopeptidase n=1 Tax=Solimonas variicoloris TaxID=254408 RepID=UPI00038222F8|nr:M14 family metallopeptidase [Solimonas variicoloris]